MAEDDMIVTMPVMHGTPAIVRRPFGFLMPPGAEEMVAVGAAPVEGIPTLFIGLNTSDGETLFGCIPAKNVNSFVEDMNRAIQQIISRSFEVAYEGGQQ